jgi:ABC-type multidrug transport system fused ATPase/permease subunit
MRDLDARGVALRSVRYDTIQFTADDEYLTLEEDVFDVGHTAMYLPALLLTSVATVAAMIAVHAGLSLAVLAPVAAALLVVRHFGPSLRTHSRGLHEQFGAMASLLQEALCGVRVLRAYDQEAFAHERFVAAIRAGQAPPVPHHEVDNRRPGVRSLARAVDRILRPAPARANPGRSRVR